MSLQNILYNLKNNWREIILIPLIVISYKCKNNNNNKYSYITKEETHFFSKDTTANIQKKLFHYKKTYDIKFNINNNNKDTSIIKIDTLEKGLTMEKINNKLLINTNEEYHFH